VSSLRGGLEVVIDRLSEVPLALAYRVSGVAGVCRVAIRFI
jgi:hypothetical protein